MGAQQFVLRGARPADAAGSPRALDGR